MKSKTIYVICGAVASLGAIAWLASPILSAYIEQHRAAVKAMEEQEVQGSDEVHVAQREKVDEEKENEVVISDRMGQFEGLKGHQAKGEVILAVREDKVTYVQFLENVDIASGTGLGIYLGSDSAYDPEAEIGVLKKSAGAQEYPLPQKINAIRYNTIWLVSKGAKVPFAKASMQNKNTYKNPNNGIVPPQ
jgi:hypothetical protein